ncbi:MAG: ABC transporter permease subunit [Candidatus Aminicenantes bacterium]|nr:ABC transporter permease subunit [Candidatus Aminicenantes bacterium]
MTIKQKGYTHWDGELKTTQYPWTPITKKGIKLAFKKKFFKFTFFLTLIPAIVFLVGIYISERLEDFAFLTQDVDAVSFLKISPKYFNSYFTNDFLLFMIVVILVFCGAGLISDDLRYNSLQLYFSRPIRKKDYFLGKASVIAFFLFILTLVPGVIFLLMKILFSGSMTFIWDYPWLIASVFGYSVFITVFFAFYTLFISSVNKNRRYVSVLIFGVYVFSDILYGILHGIFNSDYFSLISIKANLQQVGAAFFGQNYPHQVSWMLSFLILVLICVVAGYVLNKKVRGVEVAK